VTDSPLRDFFLNPGTARQREYEALRCVFVEGLSQKEAAERFHLSYQALRQVVHAFRRAVAAGAPPFSTGPGEAGLPAARPAARRGPTPPARAKARKRPTLPR
jgi:hypothetical protein